MSLQIRYFASLREALGPSEAVDAAAGATVGQVRDLLIARGGRYAEVLARGRAVRCSLNQQMCDDSALVGEGGELAFFPPVTGG